MSSTGTQAHRRDSDEAVRHIQGRIELVLLRTKSWILAVIAGTFLSVARVSFVGSAASEIVGTLMLVLLMPLSITGRLDARRVAAESAMIGSGIATVVLLRYTAMPQLVVWLCSHG